MRGFERNPANSEHSVFCVSQQSYFYEENRIGMNLKRLFYLLTLLLLTAAIASCNTADVVTDAVEDAGDAAAEVVEDVKEEAEEMAEEAEEMVEEMMEELECSDALGCVEVDAGDPIVIAYMLPTSGPVAFLGED